MSLRDRILSDTNIYAAIHALPNTLREKSLICGDQQQYIKDLREIYRYGASHDKFISHCKDKLEKALDQFVDIADEGAASHVAAGDLIDRNFLFCAGNCIQFESR